MAKSNERPPAGGRRTQVNCASKKSRRAYQIVSDWFEAVEEADMGEVWIVAAVAILPAYAVLEALL